MAMRNFKLKFYWFFVGFFQFTEFIQVESRVRWVDSSKVNLKYVEPSGVQIVNGTSHQLYYIRAMYRAPELYSVGRYSTDLDNGWFYYGGKELDVSQALQGRYEFLSFAPNETYWTAVDPQEWLPSNAVSAGKDAEYNTESYVCRSSHEEKNLIPGKYIPAFGACAYSMGGYDKF